jgi:hypothetical protein
MSETLINYCLGVVNETNESWFSCVDGYNIDHNQIWAAAHILADWHNRHANPFKEKLYKNTFAPAVQSVVDFWDNNFTFYTSTDIYNTFILLQAIHFPTWMTITRQTMLYHLKKLDNFGDRISYSQGRPYAFVA